jgi:hypothetical protein
MSESVAGVIERLFLEFENQYSLTEVVAVVRECQVHLCCSPPGALPELVDRLARHRLNAMRHGLHTDPNLASTAG